MGLTRPSLAIRQNRDIIPTEKLLKDVTDGGGVKFFICAVCAQSIIISETFLSIGDVHLKEIKIKYNEIAQIFYVFLQTMHGDSYFF